MSKKDTSFEAAMKVFNLDTSAPQREQIEYIDIDKIDGDARNFCELSGLEDLAANIELCGLQQPIRVRTIENAEAFFRAVYGCGLKKEEGEHADGK